MDFEMPTGQMSNSDKVFERSENRIYWETVPANFPQEATLPSNQAMGTQFLFTVQGVTAGTLRWSDKVYIILKFCT